MLFIDAKFELSAVKPSQYPTDNMPEIAFVGRSNVGKSSIINTLLNKKNFARVGATPGRTRQINFFNIEDQLHFVDLPGYGYAKVSKNEKNSWDEIIETYLNMRHPLKLILLLVDIRHKPSKDDQIMMDWIRRRVIPYLVVATKSDKLSRNQVNAQIQSIRSELLIPADHLVIPFSAETRQGKEEIWEQIKNVTDTPTA